MGWLLAGLALIALGIIFLLDQAGVWDAGDVISQWWPALIIVLGLSQLTSRPRPWAASVIIIAIGVILLFHQLGLFPEDAWQYIWPSLLIAAGAWILLMYWRSRHPSVTSEESVGVLAVFGDAKAASNAAAFTDGTVTAVFGEAELDLSEAGLAPGGGDIAATAIFGDSTVFVPRGWDVKFGGLPLLGDIEDKREGQETLPADAPRLRVRAVAILGDVQLRWK